MFLVIVVVFLLSFAFVVSRIYTSVFIKHPIVVRFFDRIFDLGCVKCGVED